MAQFTNQAQLSYNGSVVNSNIAVGEILEVLSASKTAVMDDYTRNDDVTYVISVVNSSTSPVTGLTVTDDLGGYAFGENTLYPLSYVNGSVRMYINGVLQLAPTVTAGPPLAFSGITLPAGGNLMIIYEAEVTQFAPLDVGGSIVNTATVVGAGLPSTVTVTETVTPEEEPELTITKFIEPVPVTENGTLTYRFIIQNYGNTAAVATDNVAVTDTFDPILNVLTVTLDGTPLALTTEYTYDVTTGVFATVPGVITVPAATYTQDVTTGAWIITPGVTELVVTGTV
ncbi:MAG: hypothetical protein E7629_05505 [Ruminococcaceae bacterium]|nr:hypothetical protein [Oscillospiraceae bacterium]